MMTFTYIFWKNKGKWIGYRDGIKVKGFLEAWMIDSSGRGWFIKNDYLSLCLALLATLYFRSLRGWRRRRWRWGRGRPVRLLSLLLSLSLISWTRHLAFHNFHPFLIFLDNIFVGSVLFSELHIFIIAAGSVLDVDAFPIMDGEMRFGSFISIELLFQFLLVHDCSAGPVAVGHFIGAFVGVVAVF